MIELKFGSFVDYMGLHCKLLSASTLKVVSNDNKSLELGFEQYPNKNLYYKVLNVSEVSSGYHVITKAIYSGHVFQITENREVLNEDSVNLFLSELDFIARDKFGFNHREDNAHISKKIEELDQIWEERESLLDFPFTVEKVKYLKGEDPSSTASH